MNGQVSGAKIKELLTVFQDDILTGVDERLKVLSRGHMQVVEQDNSPVMFGTVNDIAPTYVNGKYMAFTYAVANSPHRKFWQVPKTFVFPKCDRRDGWKFWMLGIPCHTEEQMDGTIISHPIMPFRLFNPTLLSIKARNKL